eukprot:TRINITY_DN508_c0_g1_i5.p1 TRINITY_DN508_c0_g1~~TRINITY_DN508_c0_g1_i5.p1  ORF type:complete len:541 (-),score=139.62 TRINITY_DN508_c0_g1_i5:87-1709(-)
MICETIIHTNNCPTSSLATLSPHNIITAATRTREDWKKEKELEEARKAGTAAPLKDEDGKDINPHIPQYISQAPWYLNSNRPSLKHQRNLIQSGQVAKLDEYYPRGIVGASAVKFRKGACENCGAMTHKKKECTERPRKVGAKYTSKQIAPDEVVREFSFDYEGKRDRWNGFDPSEYDVVHKLHELREQESQRLKVNDVENKLKNGVVPTQDNEANGEEAENDAPVSKVDPRTRTTVRNLRIREDTAKYLYNLDVNSAYYDPMTRSLRGNPLPHLHPDETPFAGDNFVRYTGDALKFNDINAYAWKAYDKGSDIHLQALPSLAEKRFKEHQQLSEEKKVSLKETMISKYGGEEHFEAPPPQLRLAQTENYVEYDRSGKVIKGRESAKAKSKYEEDVFPRNHTSVWGSYWKNGRWGYKCCHQFERNAYCLGDTLIRFENEKNQAAEQHYSTEDTKTAIKEPTDETKQAENKSIKSENNEGNSVVPKTTKQKRQEHDSADDDRNRPYNSGRNHSDVVTAQEMEEYHLKRQRSEDPMAGLLED